MELDLLWAALTAGAAMWLGTRIWHRGLPERPMDHLIGPAVIGLFAGRIAALVGQGVNPLAHPLDIVVVRGGVSTGVAATTALVAFAWAVRRTPSAADALAPAALAGLAGWHAGCLWRGACLGAASGLPWAWSSSASDITRHPVEIYAAIGLLVGGYVVGRLPWRPLLRAGTALALAGSVRLITEPLRPGLSGGPEWWYAAAVVVGTTVALYGERGLSSWRASDST